MCFGASLENNLKKNPTRVLTIWHTEQINLLFESKLQ
jgi:hypothetical protein